MIALFLLVLLQSAMMVGGQVLLKLGLERMGDFSWTWTCIRTGVLLNGWMWGAVGLLVAANLFWLYLLKFYPYSVAYPLTSIGFVLALLSGMWVFHETVNPLQWLGVILVMVGCYFIVR